METKVTQPTVQPLDEVPSLEAFLASDPAEAAANDGTDTAQPAPVAKPKSRRGFAAMDRAKVRELARRGGTASQLSGGAHHFTSEEAREAGRKGGRAPHRIRGRGKHTSA